MSRQDTCIGILQDTEDLLCVGYDVVTLYPDMDTDEAVRGIHEAVMNSPVSFENVDYLECTIYISLNWDQKKCNESELRRVLPVRRGKRGVRPWVKGVGPMGEQMGDAEVRGGPGGVRGTCGVARLIMQLFDGKWEARLQSVGF